MLDDKHVRQIYAMLTTQKMLNLKSITDDLEEARWADPVVKFLTLHDIVISPYEYAAIIIWTRESTAGLFGRTKHLK